MKIAFFHQPINAISLPDQDSSVEILTYEMARSLAQYCDVIVYAKRGPHQKEFEYHQGVQYRRISATVDEKFAHIFGSVDRRLPRSLVRRPLFASRLYYLKYALQVARDLRSEKCDVVHIQNFSQFATVIREFNPKIKIVLNMHCEWLTQLDQAMIESRLREIDLVIGCSEYITEKIRRRFPHFAERCQTVFDGVDINHFVSKNRRSASQKNGIKQLLFVGRVSPEKGVHVLLDAFQKVIENYPQAQLKIVGGHGSLPIQFEAALSDDPKLSELASFYDGNYFAHLQSKLSADMASHVSFAGSIPHRQLVSLYQNADMLILPTVYGEAFGMPIIEAMAMEVPVVATKCGGIPEIVVDGKTGLLVEGGDSTALAQAILRLLSDEDLRKSMGKAARKRAVELCAWEKIVANLLNYYKKICEGRD